MILSFSALFAASLAPPPPEGGNIVLRHDLGTEYNRTDYEAACGSLAFRVGFQDRPGEYGLVDYVLINGRPVSGAAQQLQNRAARRAIGRFEIMNCGMERRRPVFRGVMETSEMQSQRLRMTTSVYFRIAQNDDGDWRITFD